MTSLHRRRRSSLQFVVSSVVMELSSISSLAQVFSRLLNLYRHCWDKYEKYLTVFNAHILPRMNCSSADFLSSGFQETFKYLPLYDNIAFMHGCLQAVVQDKFDGALQHDAEVQGLRPVHECITILSNGWEVHHTTYSSSGITQWNAFSVPFSHWPVDTRGWKSFRSVDQGEARNRTFGWRQIFLVRVGSLQDLIRQKYCFPIFIVASDNATSSLIGRHRCACVNLGTSGPPWRFKIGTHLVKYLIDTVDSFARRYNVQEDRK
jgi:hypothetical protein